MPRTPTTSLVLSEQPGAEDPCDPAVHPELYDGVVIRRTVAYLIDMMLIGVAMMIAVVALWVLGVLSLGLLSPLVVILPLIPLAYHTVLIGGPRSATLGMRLFGVEVRRLDGGRPDYLQAALQTMVFYVSVGVTSSLVLVIVLFNARGRALHDYLCGTLMVRASDA